MGSINFEHRDGIARIGLDHQEKLNSVDRPMADQLAAAYQEVNGNDSIRVLVITGEGDKAFSTGGYIPDYITNNVVGEDGSGQRTPLPKPYPMAKPSIAAVRGWAVGGGFGLMLTCDLRILGRSATVGPSGLRRGVVQGGQQTQRLIRLVSFSKAMEILLLSKYISAEEAGAIGLANCVVDDSEVEATAMEWARRIASFSPWAVQKTKQLAYEGYDMPLPEALSWEEEIQVESYRRPAAEEGYGAFVDGRSADFSETGGPTR